MSTRMFAAILLIVGGVLGCKSPAPAEKGTIPRGVVEEKVQAPVTIEAVVHGSGATVTLRFPSDGESVRVVVSGAAGLGVEAGLIQEGFETVIAGSQQELQVFFDPERGAGLLNVVVEGDFGGRLLGKVQAFEVGQPKPPEHSHRQIDGKKQKDHRVGP